jgi:hypothetical protein
LSGQGYKAVDTDYDGLSQLVAVPDDELTGLEPGQDWVWRPAEVLVDRLATRTNNPYGKQPEEVARVLQLQHAIEPLLRATAMHEIDTSIPLDQVVEKVLEYVDVSG